MPLGSPWAELLLCAVSFCVGGIPFGWLVARLFKRVDLRNVGSGSTGATNCARQWQGKASIGIFIGVFALDFAKGLFGALFSLDMADALGVSMASASSPITLQVLCGMAAVLGHMFTPFLGFRGGKGVATTFGVVTALAPLSSLWGLGAWGILVALTRYVSLGSLVAMISMPFTYWADHGESAFTKYLGVWILLTVMAAVVVWRHRANIGRLLRGTERQFGRRARARQEAL